MKTNVKKILAVCAVVAAALGPVIGKPWWG
ncbi:hypothetical protein QFZ87_000795 [Bacillus sp. SLBN-46]|nr:hypothetical protein [Bacillus sp. SLBN-46]